MGNTYKVSVLIPVYNVEMYLNECLDSVVNQTLQDIEIICVNDGSTDKSGRILDDYEAKYSHIKVVHKDNSGYGHTMNVALRMASGEYVGIVESDDFADANMFEKLYLSAHSSNAEIVKSNYWHHEKGKDIYKEILTTFKYNTVFCPRRDNIFIFQGLQTIWSAIYKREFLIDNNIWFNETPGASYQDVSFVFKVLACAERVVFLEDAFLHYRVDNPTSSVNSKGKVYCIFDEIANIELFLNSRGDIKKHCMCILAPLKLRLLRENFHRIALCYKLSFLSRSINELNKTARLGYIKRDYWEESAWEQVQKLIQPNNCYLCNMYLDIQKRQLFQEGFWRRIASSKKIYLYGAGIIAKRMVEIFQRNEFHIDACFVSETKGNDSSLLGVPVIEYGTIELHEDDMILLALKEEYQYEILPKLQKDGHLNIMLLDYEMRNYLEAI